MFGLLRNKHCGLLSSDYLPRFLHLIILHNVFLIDASIPNPFASHFICEALFVKIVFRVFSSSFEASFDSLSLTAMEYLLGASSVRNITTFTWQLFA